MDMETIAGTDFTAAAKAVRANAGGPYYGLMYLAFATLAYTDQQKNKIINIGKQLPEAVASLPPPPVPGGNAPVGSWSVDWGPALFKEDQNLMYIASFREKGNPDPVMTVLSIRGTDISAGWEAVLRQFFQDTRDWFQVKWDRAAGEVIWQCLEDLVPSDKPKIAKGTCFGMKRLRDMKVVPSPRPSTEKMSALEYLASLQAKDNDLPIVVTGHSLGGCQATVMAAYLADNLPANARILPNPFAPPTAGNSAFAQKYDKRFPDGNVWWNEYDLVPNAYAKGDAKHPEPGTLAYAKGLWQKVGGPGSTLVETLTVLRNTLPDYAQPTAGTHQLKGIVAPPSYIVDFFGTMDSDPKCEPDSYKAQLMWQHFPPCYYMQIKKQFGSDVAPYPYPGKLPNGGNLPG
ncbi:MAG TPA: hypothetical protein VEA41_04865 [Salinarimonas sp.]|nr:hypothetical protein [Salinarimonas sp.]